MFFNRFRLRTRIFFGFGLLIALLLGVAGFGSFGLSTVGREIGKMEALSGNVHRIQDVVLKLEMIRRALTRFRIDADPSSLQETNEEMAKAAKLLADASQVTLSAQRQAMYGEIAEKLKFVAGRNERFTALISSGLAGRKTLTDSGGALSSAATKIAEIAEGTGAPADAKDAITSRAAVRAALYDSLRFLVSYDPTIMPQFRREADAAGLALSNLEKGESEPIKAAIPALRSLLNDYVATFEKVAASLNEGEELYSKEIRPAIRDMQAVAGKALGSLTTAFDDATRNANHVASSNFVDQLVLTAGGTVLGAILALLIARSIIKPVGGMTTAMTKLAAGDTSSEVPAKGNTDEIGEMARAVEVFRLQAIENVRLAGERERDHAAKQRRQAAMNAHTDDFGKSVSGVMDSFMAAADSMRQAATEVNEGARQTRSSTSSTVEGASLSARDLNSVAAAAEEMAVSINEISQQVAHVTTSVQAAVDRASETDRKVAGLSEAADRIGDVVRIITDIAGQTNLLALNATIEAARAGEAGKGFAVVAGEVKALASQTARATDQIGAQIVAIRNATGEAVAAVRDVGTAIGQVETVATAIAAAVEEQAAATREITNSVQMVTATTSAAAEAMRQVLSIAQSTDTSSAAALDASTAVGRTAETLRAEVTDFLTAMSQGDDEERRLYERVPARGIQATLQFAGQAAVQAVVEDIARGGMAIQLHGQYSVGTDVGIELPAGCSIRGRVTRCENGLVGLAFRQDTATLEKVDRVLSFVGQSAVRKAG